MPQRYYTAYDNSFDASITFNCDYPTLAVEEVLKEIFGRTNNTKKETKKMEAKKCDRCGKLYEIPTADENGNGAEVRFKYKYIRNADNMSEKAIVEEQTRNIYIKHGCGDNVDFCPTCRASLKKWFESADKEGKKNV